MSQKNVKHQGFMLDRNLEQDSEHVAWLSLCEIRLMDDARWPWLLLIPQRKNIQELFQLAPLDQVMMTFETNLVAEMLHTLTECDKLNIAAIGNKVSQLHMHIIARNVGDPVWPDPVWGNGSPKPYQSEILSSEIKRLKLALNAAR